MKDLFNTTGLPTGIDMRLNADYPHRAVGITTEGDAAAYLKLLIDLRFENRRSIGSMEISQIQINYLNNCDPSVIISALHLLNIKNK